MVENLHVINADILICDSPQYLVIKDMGFY